MESIKTTNAPALNKHGYPFVGIFRVTLFTKEFCEWIYKQYVTSTGYKHEFDVNDVFWGLCNDKAYFDRLTGYYTKTFGLPATSVAMIPFYQNKWSGRYWAEIDGEEVKPDQCNRVYSYSSDTTKSFN